MFDIGWTELMVIGVVALIVIGPKDLPEMFRTLGRFTAKARSMAREFQRAMESAADDTGLRDVADDLRKATSARSMGLDAVKNAATKFEAWDPLKPKPGTSAVPDPDAPAAPAAPPTAAATIAAGAAATAAPVAAEAVAAAPLGPATTALAEEVATKRAARLAEQAARQAQPKTDAPAPAGAAPEGHEQA
ncbi:Sec-independent protein translocase protein TatB [Gemmobacter fulvus]|uniref:Sec-independent protein translocase protein TatB n=1 Tax=Gemmobacter fulvus TaxID=2840474 RepID=A0A975P826_9RHOB|nr:Sec-independent protein translocase protein TatB [Gemmobacter fulvus]MBT9243959.1 Sec-independent protein translocase protein TatB [Gemmobacter fulvus]MDQ1849171.1 Sec-independent protein translocase protein TatB [Gemmobacter fulvus]QWK90873.1 Sec-independent protein translocase protein TatB [Gemmobacter fulvus]